MGFCCKFYSTTNIVCNDAKKIKNLIQLIQIQILSIHFNSCQNIYLKYNISGISDSILIFFPYLFLEFKILTVINNCMASSAWDLKYIKFPTQSQEYYDFFSRAAATFPPSFLYLIKYLYVLSKVSEQISEFFLLSVDSSKLNSLQSELFALFATPNRQQSTLLSGPKQFRLTSMTITPAKMNLDSPPLKKCYVTSEVFLQD